MADAILEVTRGAARFHSQNYINLSIPKLRRATVMKKLNFREVKQMERVVFCKTKTGKGFKIVVDDVWLYTSMTDLLKVLLDQAESCQFRTYQEDRE